jgi:hypothetical protein
MVFEANSALGGQNLMRSIYRYSVSPLLQALPPFGHFSRLLTSDLMIVKGCGGPCLNDGSPISLSHISSKTVGSKWFEGTQRDADEK